jgi:hypothetical protein
VCFPGPRRRITGSAEIHVAGESDAILAEEEVLDPRRRTRNAARRDAPEVVLLGRRQAMRVGRADQTELERVDPDALRDETALVVGARK